MKQNPLLKSMQEVKKKASPLQESKKVQMSIGNLWPGRKKGKQKMR